jgi:DNA-binding NtrC family response regulator
VRSAIGGFEHRLQQVLDAVLFVDDDDDLRAVMLVALSGFGVRHVVTAASLQEIRDRREEVLRCQLAILDINLGNGQPTGVQVHDWLRREGFTNRTIFLTGHGSSDPRVRAAASVAGPEIISKPISIAALRELVEGAR